MRLVAIDTSGPIFNIQWNSLNKGVVVPDSDPTEIQVERFLRLYQRALRFQQKARYEEARELYEEIVSDDLVQNGPVLTMVMGTENGQDASKPASVSGSPLSRLRFLVYKNYASLLEHDLDTAGMNDEQLAKKAIKYNLKAVSIDDTDNSLWYHIGRIAYASKNLRLARLAFENGFYVIALRKTYENPHSSRNADVFRQLTRMFESGTISPLQWLCMEGLCKVLVDIGDDSTCNMYMQLALIHYPNWPLSKVLKDRMDNNVQSPSPINESETTTPLSIKLVKLDWKSLLDKLLHFYNDISDSKRSDAMSFLSRQIRIEFKDEKHTTPRGTAEPEIEMESMSHEIAASATEAEDIEMGEAAMTLNDDGAHSHSSDAAKQLQIIEIPSSPSDVSPLNRLSNEYITISDENAGIVDVRVTLKRKRFDDNMEHEKEKSEDEKNENGDDGEEEEEEDKRASLRISKRQKEKIENEETSRRKMLEEEDQLRNQVQELLNSLPEGSFMKRNTPWTLPEKDMISSEEHEAYFSWFDGKISELGRASAWDFDNNRFNRIHEQSHVETKESRLYAIFKPSSPLVHDTQLHEPVEDTSIQQFINSINAENSGITDVLCRVVLHLIELDTWTPIEDQALVDSMVDVIIVLNQAILNQILELDVTQNDLKNKIVLRICERCVDKLIRAIMLSVEITSSSAHKRRSISSKHSPEMLVQECMEISKSWIGIFERMMLKDMTDSFLSAETFMTNTTQCTSTTNDTLLRYWFVKGKMGQCNEHVEEACGFYQRCESGFKTVGDNQPKAIFLGGRYDSVLSQDSIREKLESMEFGRKVLSAKNNFNSGEFILVIQELEGLVDLSCNTQQHQDMYELLILLTRSFAEIKDYASEWKYLLRTLSRTVRDLVMYGLSQSRAQQVPSKETETDFLKYLKRLEVCLRDLLSLLLDKRVDPAGIDSESYDALVIVLHMSIYYIFRHPDFIPLVNNFVNPGAEPHTPSNVTRASGFNIILVDVWVLTSMLIQRSIREHPSENSKNTKDKLLAALLTLHDELGEREICGVSKGIFLKHLLKLLTTEAKIKHRIGVYQCYHCLYGLHLAAESDSIEEHNAIHETLSQKAAEPLFALVVDSVIDRLNRGAPLRNDLKDVVETVSNLFENLPSGNMHVELNQYTITKYLSQDIKLQHSIADMMSECRISAVPIYPERSRVSLAAVYSKIFWIGGKILRMQIRNRAKVNPERTMDDLEDAIKLFTNHIILNPNHISGWSELGQCLLQLADEELIWSATNINSHRYRIAEYHRKAYHAFWQAWYLLRREGNQGLSSAALFDLFSNFGMLLYSMTCPPMYGAGFRPKAIRRAISRTKQSLGAVESRNAYKLAVAVFSNTLKYKSSDNSEWRCLFMLGKCYQKLDRPAKMQEVLEWFLRAVDKSPPRAGHTENKDKILEPIYKLCSVLAKYLHKGEIQPMDVAQYLDFGPDEELHHGTESTDSEKGCEMKGSVLVTRVKGAIMEEKEAYEWIFHKLDQVLKIDKRRWHHRPVFRHAWMQYHIYNNPEEAKNELMTLFALRSNNKSHMNIWKPGFERPGKYFEYVHEYTMFLIQLAAVVKDVECLKLLTEKLPKASAILLYSDEAIRAAEKAYAEATQSQPSTVAVISGKNVPHETNIL
ncbi:hypothetical protein BX666DRAFT_2031252 [Dichotomocladium elegans]|nr:hypothetical protein BX666DRAFT_2031252 [Dichotomocladium elegans]